MADGANEWKVIRRDRSLLEGSDREGDHLVTIEIAEPEPAPAPGNLPPPTAAPGPTTTALAPLREPPPAGRAEQPEPAIDPLLAPFAPGALGRFFTGFSYPFRAIRFLFRQPGLLVHAAGLLTLYLLLLGGALWGALRLTPWLMDQIWSRPEGWLLYLWYVTIGITGLLLAAVALALTYVVAGLIATPLNDLLAERVELRLLGERDTPFRWSVFLRDSAVSVWHSLLNLAVYLAIMAPLLLLNLIPVAGSALFAVLSTLAMIFFLARDLLDGPLTRARLTYHQKAELIRKQRALTTGLGTAAMLMTWIPILNLFLMPLAVVGGAMLYCRLEYNGLVPQGLRGQKVRRNRATGVRE